MNEKEIERILKAFANRRRLAILRTLLKKNEMTVTEIAQSIKLSFRATSKHLGILSSVDILEKEQRGLQIFYSINVNSHELARLILRALK